MKISVSTPVSRRPSGNVSATDIEAFLVCPQKFAFFTEERLVSKFVNENMLVGSAVHAALALYYSAAYYSAASEAAMIAEGVRYITQEIAESREKGFIFSGEESVLQSSVSAVLSYYYAWSAEEDYRWRIVGVEVPFSVEFWTGCSIVGVVDAIVQDEATGKLWIVDHKTTGHTSTENLLPYAFSMQAYLYPWVANKTKLRAFKGLTLVDEDPRVVEGVIFNLISKSPPSVPRILKNGSVSQDKSQRTTATLYKQVLHARGLDEKDYTEMLASLEGRKYNERIPVAFTQGQADWFGEFLWKVLVQMKQPDSRVCAAPSRTCSFCDYRSLCEEGIRRNRPWRLLTLGTFLQRESHDLFGNSEEG